MSIFVTTQLAIRAIKSQHGLQIRASGEIVVYENVIFIKI